MPPRPNRGGGGQGPPPPPQQPPQQQQQQQQQQLQPPPPPPQQQHQPPPPQQQGGYGNQGGPPSHLHMFHQHNNSGGYGDGGRGGNMGPPQHGGGGNNGSNMSNNSMMYGGGGGNAPTSPMYGGGGGGYGNSGAPSHMMPPPSPHPQHQQMGGMGNDYGPPPHGSPYPQQGGGTGSPNSSSRRVRTPGASSMPPPPPQSQQGPPPPPHPQHGFYGGGNQGGMGYGGNMRGSAPPPPPHMEPSPSFTGGGPPPGQQQGMMRDNSYGPDMDNSPPPPNIGYRGGPQHNMQMQSPPVQQQQQHYQGNNSYGGNNRGMQGQHMQMPPPPQQQQQPMPPQQMMSGGGPNSGGRGMGPGPMVANKPPQQPGPPPPPQGGGGGNNSSWGPQQPLPPPHMQANVSPKPQSQPPPQPPMGGGGGGMQYGGGGGQGPMMGRGRVGNRLGGGGMGPGPMGNMGAPPPPPMQQQQQQRQPPQPPGMMGNIGQQLQGNGMGVNGMLPPPSQVGPMMGQGIDGPGMYPPHVDPGMGGMDPNMMGGDGMMGGMGMPPMQGGYIEAEHEVDLSQQQTLYEFLMEKHLLRQTTLSNFFPPNYDVRRDGPYTIAVDGNYMITNLRAQLQQTDPLWFLHSCLPDCLLSLVHDHVEQMRAHHLEPLWVLNGIGINGDVEAFLPSPDELRARDAVWAKLYSGTEIPTFGEISEAFETSSAIGEDVLRAIQRFLRTEEHVVCVTAPFLNWCQMATLHKEGIAQLLMGPPEMLMVPYADMKCIAEVNLETSEVAYFDRDEVLRTLFPHYVTAASTAAAGDRFMDFGLLIASHPAITTAHASVQLSTMNIYEELSTPNPHFTSLHDFIDRFEFQQNRNERPNFEKLKHSKGRTYIQYSPVFSSQASFESSLVYFIRVLDPTLTNKDMPNNLSGVFGYLVPLSLFYFQFTGLLSVSLMTAVTQLYIRDEFPVADTDEYHNVLHPLMALRGQIISQVVSRIRADAYGQRLGKISWIRWFDSILMNVLPPDRLIVLDEWNLSDSASLAEVPDDQLENIDMAMVLSLKSSTMCVPAPQLPSTAAPGDAPILYCGRKETFFAILLKTFDFVGYFSHSMNPKEAGEGGADQLVPGQLNPDDQGSSNRQDDMGDSMNGDGGAMQEQNVFFTAYLRTSLEHCPHEFQCALVRFTEMLRVNFINSIPFTCADSMQSRTDKEDPMAEMEADPPEVLLATRIACLVSIPYQVQASESGTFAWTPVYSRQLCAFTVMARVMNRSLRVLTEAIAAAQFLSGLSDCSLDDYESMSTLLPFGDVPSSLGGLLLHYVLVFPPDYEENCRTPEDRCSLLERRFKAIPNMQTQLRRVMEFTFHALYLLNVYLKKDPTIVSAGDLQPDVVSDALNLLRDKWEQHLDGPAPEDVHGFYFFQ